MADAGIAQGLPAQDPNELFAEVVSGRFDDEPQALADDARAEDLPASEQDDATRPESAPAAADGEERLPQPALASPPRVRTARAEMADVDAPKLHKVLAQSGLGSRRDLEQLIVEGRVSVNGRAAHVGQRIAFGDRIAIDGKPVRVQIAPAPARVLAYHKPAGEVVTHDDPMQRPTVFRRLPRLARGKWQSVGRLDLNTEGLLLFTSSGDLANRLMHPRFGLEREYAVRVLGPLADEERQRLLQGVDIDGQPASFLRVEDGGGEGVNRWYRVTIAEGRNREVRKLFDAVGHAVSRLIRIRYGSVVLPRGLRRGMWVELGPADIRALRQAAGPSPQAGTSAAPVGRQDGRRGAGRGRKGRSANELGLGLTGSGAVDLDVDGEPIGRIPNPLQQTYDKRAMQQARKERAFNEDGPIPNPLQQTFDKRPLLNEPRLREDTEADDDLEGPIPNPLQQTFDKRFAQGRPGGTAAPSGRRRPKGPGGAGQGRKPASGGQPDPMRTAVGYIGADAFLSKPRQGKGPKSSKGGKRRR